MTRPTSAPGGPPGSALPDLTPGEALAARAASAPLLRWFASAKRALPWREVADPYAIWVSEVMLQQTRVETVLARWGPFLARFPTLEALARADEEDVRAAWSGLGYYRRARALHEAARRVVAEHGGRVPADPGAFAALPGVGRYTAGAVLSIAFGARLPVVDGNVTRVLARRFALEGDLTRAAARRKLWALAAASLADAPPGDVNQALMELGATVCRPRAPRCDACPVAEGCAARALGAQDRLPAPARAREVPFVRRASLLVERADGAFLLVQRPPGGLLGALWELPSRELEPGDERPARAAAALARALGVRGRPAARGEAVHAFTHRTWAIATFRASGEGVEAPAGARWVTARELASLGVPTATRRALAAAGAALGAGAAASTQGPRGRPRAARATRAAADLSAGRRPARARSSGHSTAARARGPRAGGAP